MKTLKHYAKIWWMLTRNSFTIVLGQRSVLVIYLTGKILRFVFFTAFLFYLIQGTQTLAGYNANQVIFFFLTLNVVDILSQFLFREVYRFKPKIVSGDFDLTLIKPLNPLFVSLMGGADIIDLFTLPPLLYLVFHYGALLSPSPLHVAFYILLVINGLLIAAAFYTVVISVGIITLEADHTVMIFRDLESLARFPIDIYKEPLKSLLTYFLPIAIMIAVPAKAMMGLISLWGVVIACLIGVVALYFSLRFWNFALKHYTSASS